MQMDEAAAESLQENPSEDEFCLALRNGLVLCNVLNRVNPGAVSKVARPDSKSRSSNMSVLSFDLCKRAGCGESCDHGSVH